MKGAHKRGRQPAESDSQLILPRVLYCAFRAQAQCTGDIRSSDTIEPPVLPSVGSAHTPTDCG
jgi:hypothetical protein